MLDGPGVASTATEPSAGSDGVTDAEGVGDGLELATGVVGLGADVGVDAGVAVAPTVGFGVGFTVGRTVGLGVGDAVLTTIVPDIRSGWTTQ